MPTVTPMFRVSYPNVFKAKKNDLNGKDEYSLVALFPKDADLSALKKAAQDAIIEKWGPDKTKWPDKLKSPFRDQGEKAKKDDKGAMVLPDGHEAGAIFLTLRSTQRPGLIDQQKQDIIDSSAFYGGCFARASVSVYAYDQKGNRGVGFGLQNVQKMKDGPPFGGRTLAQDDFTPIEGAAAAASSASSPTDLFN